MSSIDLIELVANLITILALLIGAALAILLFLQFAPILNLRLSSEWVGKNSRWVVLKMEVENVSRVRVTKQYIHLQVLPYKYPPKNEYLSEWVPFQQEKISQTEQPMEWQYPDEVFESTLTIDPNESLSVERLIYCPPDTILKVGLQAKISFGFLGRMVARLRSWDHSWTTTMIIARN